MRVLSVVGARPQFVKLAPIARAMAGHADHLIAHTGQHYDHNMSDAFFADLGIPHPDFNLGVGSGKHGEQTGAMLAGLEKIIEDTAPDWVLVYGDTNSTLAAAVAAVKLHVRVAHLEAGLRSFNRRMPEEHNRVLTDHAADLLLAPTQVAMDHLATEGLAERSVLVGDVMTDVLYQVRDQVAGTPVDLATPVERGGYYVATIHRPDNTDDPARLRAIIDGIAKVGKPVVLLAHPRLRGLAERHGIELGAGSITVSEPVGYPQLVNAVVNSAGVITDSGGLQKEAFLLRVPCTTLRPETEWVETVELGWNVLVDRDFDALAATVERPRPADTDAAPYGTGQAAAAAVRALVER
ncbi:non-hydrolyzing UDP-N-acetylglucosamine 2-epimerase [Actinokineospora sp. UTMC 2448]|uniref:non-hydrolyzing UDP-N-acetylglucosamine 2-epimerase n=1 Tax=Actinokineospora sp. UTMC 2448 TaxID=2268449 RepID=UPI002164E83E|nr:UDP-N-acetylglucosamine 2-epimerase (non-hydrolyzing) [Actinokineospora sp. UTMC 2448]UVS82444.1 UDP-2,3-diacetamido-2,3-dideoxy-D-glucuronate 2-epimerase [Actinokineospora sp. UTMC 2448]